MTKPDGWRLNGVGRFKVGLASHLHRARRVGVEGGFRLDDWMAILQHYTPDFRCLACGEIEALTVDHVIPLTMDGSTNWPENLQPLCETCNKSKNSRAIDYRPDKGQFARELTEKRKRDPGPWQKFVYLKPIWEKRERERGRILRTSDMAERIKIDSVEMQRLKCGYAEFPKDRIIIALCNLFFCQREDILFDAIGKAPESVPEAEQARLFQAVSNRRES